MTLGQTIVERLKTTFPDVRLKLQDTGGGNHWDLTIASDQLKGLSKVKQHQAIYKPLRDLIDSNEVHALKIAVVPLEDWED